MNSTKILFLLLCMVFSGIVCGQPETGISADGNYVFGYNFTYHPSLLLVQSTGTAWKKEIYATVKSGPVFSKDNRRLIYQSLDTVVILTLRTNEQIDMPGIKEYRFIKNLDLLLLTRNNGKHMIWEWVDLNGKTLETIKLSDLGIPEKDSLLNFAIAGDGNSFAFVMGQMNTDSLNTIWFYKRGMNKAVLLARKNTAGVDSGLCIGSADLRFSYNGDRLFFTLQEIELPKPDPTMIKLDVWSYLDPRPQSLQLKDAMIRRRYLATAEVEKKRVIRLEQDNELVQDQITSINDEYALVTHFDSDMLNYRENSSSIFEYYILNEYNWNKATGCSVYLVSLKDGSRKLLKDHGKSFGLSLPYFKISPDERYVIYFDPAEKNYFSYEISNGITRNITGKIHSFWDNGYLEDKGYGVREYYTPKGIAAWLPADKKALICDRSGDIWQIDPSGLHKPVCITGRSAKKYGLYDSRNSDEKNMIPIITGDEIILSVYNNLYQRFYKTTISKPGIPRLLLDGEHYFYSSIKKAAEKSAFVFLRESITDPPALFYTSDFAPLSTLYLDDPGRPRKKQIRTEIIRWKTADGIEAVGNLYYPIDFDPGKKYPVIFDYYEKYEGGVINRFECLNAPEQPQNEGPAISSRYCTSHGYFYFEPGIYYKPGNVAWSVYSSIVPAAKLLMKRPYIDGRRMGAHGHSFGGYETNLLVTRTNLFAAACSGSGLTDLFSLYGAEARDGYGYSNIQAAEVGQERLGVNPWERPDLYLKSSPVFYADRITTPLLMGIGKKDYRVPTSQGIELFNALRRLGKKAWLIAYDDGDHGIGGDWDLRMMQFFDHYLKGAPAPVWMTRGIPSRMKGRTLGLEYDTTIATPGPGLLMNDGIRTPGQQELLKHRTTVNENGQIVEVKP